jgi:penicillin-binding protein 1A
MNVANEQKGGAFFEPSESQDSVRVAGRGRSNVPHFDSVEPEAIHGEAGRDSEVAEDSEVGEEGETYNGQLVEDESFSRRRNKKRLSFSARVLRFFARILTLLVGGSVGTVALVAVLALLGSQLPPLVKSFSFATEKIGTLTPLNQRSKMLDKDGRLISVLRSEQNRLAVPLDRVPKHLVQTVLAVEDADFYIHKGINLRSTVRAMAANVEAGGVAQGGSTITQQLVKLTLLTSKQDVNRKIKEARFSLQIEKQFTKDEILERYLNTVYFGEGAYGVQAAAERYFNKDVSALTIAESAFLAGMIRNPVGYDPIRFRDRSRQRRSVVVTRMLKVGLIKEPEAEAIRLAPMPRPADRFTIPDAIVDTQGYFVEEVKRQLLEDPRLGETRADRFNAVFNGGLTIRTTLDQDAQALADKAVRETLPSGIKDFTAALVSVDNTTGAVRAMVGGRGFATDKYNLVTQGTRQPGSSWKPIVMIAAMERGISPESLIDGSEPCAIPNPTGKQKIYKPRNAEDAGGVETVMDQLVVSSNCAFARLAYINGYDKIREVAKRLGISTKIDLVPSIALGVEEVHPFEMASVYATIAAGGRQRKAYVIEEVLDRNNKTIFKGRSSDRVLIDPEIARAVTAAMQGVVERGTGTAAQLEGRDVAGKTGTTNGYSDAWFDGFTPQVTTVVWMGAPDRKKSMTSVGGVSPVYGGTYPAAIFNRYMTDALANQPPEFFRDLTKSSFDIGDCINLTVQKPVTRRQRKGDPPVVVETPGSTVDSRQRVRCGNFRPAASSKSEAGKNGKNDGEDNSGDGATSDTRKPRRKKAVDQPTTTRKKRRAAASDSSGTDNGSSDGGSDQPTSGKKKKRVPAADPAPQEPDPQPAPQPAPEPEPQPAPQPDPVPVLPADPVAEG